MGDNSHTSKYHLHRYVCRVQPLSESEKEALRKRIENEMNKRDIDN